MQLTIPLMSNLAYPTAEGSVEQVVTRPRTQISHQSVENGRLMPTSDVNNSHDPKSGVKDYSELFNPEGTAPINRFTGPLSAEDPE